MSWPERCATGWSPIPELRGIDFEREGVLPEPLRQLDRPEFAGSKPVVQSCCYSFYQIDSR